MNRSSIKIGRVTIEAEIQDKSKSNRYFDLFSRLFKSSLENVIFEAIKKYDDPDKLVTIKKLEINLGEIQLRNIPSSFSRLLEKELKKWLGRNYEVAQKMTGRPVEDRFGSKRTSGKSSSKKSSLSSAPQPLINISSKKLAETELIKQILDLGFNVDQLDLIPFELSKKLELILATNDRSNFLELFNKQITESSVSRVRSIVGNEKFMQWVAQLTNTLSVEDIRRVYLTQERMRYFSQKSVSLDRVSRLPEIFYRIGKSISDFNKKLKDGLPARTFIHDKDGITQMVDGNLFFRKNFYEKVVNDIKILKSWGFSDWLRLDDLPRDRDRPWDFKRLAKYFDTIEKMPDIRTSMIDLTKRAQSELKNIIPEFETLQIEIIERVSKDSWNAIRKYFPKTSHTLLKTKDLTSFEEYFFSSMKAEVKKKKEKAKIEELLKDEIAEKVEKLLPSVPVGKELFDLVRIIFKMLESDGSLQMNILKDHLMTQQMSEMLKLLEIKTPSKFEAYRELDLVFYYLHSGTIPSWFDPIENIFPFKSVNSSGRLNINRILEYQILFIPGFIKAFINKFRAYSTPARKNLLISLSISVKNDLLFDILQPYVLGSRYMIQRSRQVLNRLEENKEETLIHYFEKIILSERAHSIHELMKSYLSEISLNTSVPVKQLVAKLDVPESWKEIILAKDIIKVRIDLNSFHGYIEKFRIPDILIKELQSISDVIESISQNKAALYQINNSLSRLYQLRNLDVWNPVKMNFEDPDVQRAVFSLRSDLDALVATVREKLKIYELERQLINQVEEILRSYPRSDQKTTLIKQLEVLVIPLGIEFFPEDIHEMLRALLTVAERITQAAERTKSDAIGDQASGLDQLSSSERADQSDDTHIELTHIQRAEDLSAEEITGEVSLTDQSIRDETSDELPQFGEIDKSDSLKTKEKPDGSFDESSRIEKESEGSVPLPHSELHVDPKTGLAFDQKTGLTIDPRTGLAVDPITGFSIDPRTGLAVDPITGLSIDPKTGFAIDPITGLAVDPKTGLSIDPKTGLPIDNKSAHKSDKVTQQNTENEDFINEKNQNAKESELKTKEEKLLDLIMRGHLPPEEYLEIEDEIEDGFLEQMAEIKQILSRMRIPEMLQQNWSWINLSLLRTWEEHSELVDLKHFQKDISEFHRALSNSYSDFVKKIRIYMVVNFEKAKYDKKELIEELIQFIAASKSNTNIIRDVLETDPAQGTFLHGLKKEMERVDMQGRIEEYFESDETRSKKYRLLWDKYGGLQDIPVRNAGLVLVWPFISTMFKKLKYFNEKGLWLDKNAQIKAVVLLNYLCSGKDEYEEHFLVFNKVLCGLPVDEPIEAGLIITQSEKRWVKKLLQNTIRQWPALKKTSIDSLQGSFLMRNGVLYNKDPNTWLVKVDRKPFDILLTKLPWSFKMIRLRWTIYTITVDWDYQIT